MSADNLTLTTPRNWRTGRPYEPSSPDRDNRENRNPSIPLPLHHRQEESGGLFAPWRLFEERVRTGPYGLSGFPSQPYSPIRIFIRDRHGITEIINPRLRQFIRDSPPRIRGEWQLTSAPETEAPSLTNNEFKKAMKQLKKQVYHPSQPKKKARRAGLFSKSSTDSEDEEKGERKDCAVCLESFVPNEQVLVTPCNHVFHNDCLVPWVKSHGKCPVCRFSFCERGETAPSSNNNNNSNRNSSNNTNNNNNNRNVEVEDLTADLIFLIRAMEEAFNWIDLAR